MPGTTGVLVFEGGHGDAGAQIGPDGPLRTGGPGLGAQALLALVRQWTTLDTIAKFLDRPEVDVVVLATDAPGLAAEAARAGARPHPTGPGFHFGRTLHALVTEHHLEKIVYLGGGSVPLLDQAGIDLVLGLIAGGGRVFVANSPQSPDLVALGSTEVTSSLAALETDNATLFALSQGGYERVLLPETAAVTFDLDTPADILFLAWEGRRETRPPRLGRRCLAGLAGLNLDLSTLERAAAVLRWDYPAVTLVGRVAGSTVAWLNANLRLRLRVFSEERGMKALGRIERGEVVSLLGAVARDQGLGYLVRQIACLSEAVFWDTRVLLAHLGGRPGETDRFEADLGRWERVGDPLVRRLYEAAATAGPPFVLGGHSVVAGGLRLVAEGLLGSPADPPAGL